MGTNVRRPDKKNRSLTDKHVEPCYAGYHIVMHPKILDSITRWVEEGGTQCFTNPAKRRLKMEIKLSYKVGRDGESYVFCPPELWTVIEADYSSLYMP